MAMTHTLVSFLNVTYKQLQGCVHVNSTNFYFFIMKSHSSVCIGVLGSVKAHVFMCFTNTLFLLPFILLSLSPLSALWIPYDIIIFYYDNLKNVEM